MAPATAPRFEWVSDRERFAQLRDDWNALGASNVDTVFLTYDWLANWLELFAPDAQLRILTAWDAEKLVAVLPLFADPSSDRGRRWAFMGTGTLTPNHLDIIAEPAVMEAARAGFIGQLLDRAAEWDVLDFDKLPDDTETIAEFESAFRAAGLATARRESAICSICDLPATYAEALAQRSKSTRKKIRATTLAVQKEPAPIHLARADSEADALRALECLIGFHQARWTAKGYPGAFANPRVRQFHEAAVLHALAAGLLRMYTLAEGDSLIAVSYNFRVGATAQAYLTSFDEQWSRLSPGVFLRAYVIEQLIDEGVEHFDWLEGAEEYKRTWCTRQRRNLRLRVFSRSLAGRLGHARHAGNETAVALARRWVSPELRERAVRTLARLRARR